MLLESLTYELSSLFVTLTYDDEHLPKDGSVSVRELQLFMKRLRRKLGRKVRFYGVGEYGDLSGRPHYHLVLFGLGDVGHMVPAIPMVAPPPCDCVICASWRDEEGVPKGFSYVGELTAESAAYVASYTTKGVLHESVAGKAPEFARMSLRPGIGAAAMSFVREALNGLPASVARPGGDVPRAVRQDGKLWPLGRYLSRKLRTSMGLGESVPDAVLARVYGALQVELSQAGGRSRRDSRRKHGEQRSVARRNLNNLKKGVGL